MSRSNNVVVPNPCVRWFEWAGSEGKLRYYDRETKETHLVELPFNFLALDRLHTVCGYCDAEGSGFRSNEVRNSQRDLLTVRTKSGIVATGVWKQLRAITGLRYAQSVYLGFKDEAGQLVIGNIKASGAFVSSWIEFGKGKNLYEGAIAISGAEEARKGANKYFVPALMARKVSPETDAAAKEPDIALQEYLTAYCHRQAQGAATAAPFETPAAMSEEPDFPAFQADEPPVNGYDYF